MLFRFFIENGSSFDNALLAYGIAVGFSDLSEVGMRLTERVLNATRITVTKVSPS